MEFKSYTVKVKTPSQWEEFHNTLLSSSSVNHIPDREVICSDDKKHSPTRGTYLLTDDEANDLREHHFVDWIELCPTCYPELYPKPKGAARRFKRNIKVYRDLFLNAPADPTGSVVFDGNGDSLSTADNADFEFGSGDFTVEGWIYLNSIGQNRCIVSKWGSSGGQEFIIRIASDGRLNTSISNGSSTFSYTSSQTLSTNTWYHFAAVKNGPTDYKIYIDGVVTLNSSLNFTIPSSSNNLLIGSVTGTQQFFDGKISNLRIVKGSAVYTSNFTVPTKIDNITNTVLLCCNSSGSPIAESTGKTITTIGDPQPSRDNPGFKFPYIPDTVTPAVTGSVDFDGSGDNLTVPNSSDLQFENNDFTIEFWVRPNSQAGNRGLVTKGVGTSNASTLEYALWLTNSHQVQLRLNVNGAFVNIVTPSALDLDTWSHFALTREGENIRFFKNGVQFGGSTQSSSFTIQSNTESLYIGENDFGDLNGYISNVRIVKGTALYTSNFTVPTEELEVISSPNLITNGTFDTNDDGWEPINFIHEIINGQLKITRNGSVGTYQTITTVPGKTYYASCLMNSLTTVGGLHVRDGVGWGTAITVFTGTAGQTVTIGGTFTALSTTTSIGIGLGTNLRSVIVDDVVVQEYATSLLCCQSPTDATEEATGKTITVNGNATASTESPGLLTGEFDRTYNSPEVIRTNWGVQRVGLATNGDFWTGTGDLAPEFTDIGYNMTGKNVDIIIQDSGVLQYHPEFMDGKGQSRVRDIVLDGPLYLDPTSSYLQANTYTKADGRVGIATTAAHNWWNNNSSGYRSTDFDAPETTGSVAFDGTFDYLLYQNTADPSDLQLGSASFTIEGWVYLNSLGSSRGIIGKWGAGGPSDQEFIIRSNSINQIQIDLSNGTSISSADSSSRRLTQNTWHHFAVVRNGNASLQIYIDGLLASSTAYNGTLPSTSSNLVVSGVSGAGEFWNGYISNLRMVKGTVLYTSNFTPPTEKLEATLPGVVGSVAFDGANDYLSIPSSSDLQFGSGDFTIEGWFYLNSLNKNQAIVNKWNGPASTSEWNVFINAGNQLTVNISNGSGLLQFSDSQAVSASTWYHFAIVKSGNNIKIFKNGQLREDSGVTVTIPSNTANVQIGEITGVYDFDGYISNLRLVKGTAIYYLEGYGPDSGPLAGNVFEELFDGNTSTGYQFRATSNGASFNPITVNSQLRIYTGSNEGELYLNQTIPTGHTPTVFSPGWVDVTSSISSFPFQLTDLGYHNGSNTSSTALYAIEVDGVIVTQVFTPPTEELEVISSPNLITNGTFDTASSIDDWVADNSIVTWDSVNGRLQIQRSGGTGLTAYLNISTVPGRTYTLNCDFTGPSSGNGNAIFVGDGAGVANTNVTAFDIAYIGPNTTAAVQLTFTALSTTSHIRTTIDSNGQTIYIDNLVVQEYATSLLCCQSGVSATLEATGKTLTVNGNPVASTENPGLTGNRSYDASLLCCQSPTDATEDATGKAITAVGNATASTESPGLTIPGTGTKDFGTIAVSSTYVVDNTLGESLDGTSGITDGHGTACAGLAAGKNAGAAFEANIWNMSGIDEPPSLTISIEQNHDLMKIFHKYKPINPQTGIKNPTIINGSWGYFASFTQNGPVSFNFRGTSGTYSGSVTGTGNDLLGKAMVDGLYVSDGKRSFAVDSGSSATETAADELMAEGPIYIAAAGNNNQMLGIGADDPDRLNTIGSFECNHRDFMHPQGIGFDSANDYHPVICIGAMDDEVETNYEERKADYSNNGPGVDVWSPADSTLAPGLSGDSLTYMRHDDTRFYDRYFNGTSAAAPVTTGVLALYLQSNPKATQKQTKKWLNRYGSKIGSPYRDDETDDQTTSYWTGSYNMRGAEKRILFNPYYTNASRPQPALLSTSGVLFGGVSISVK